MSLAVTALYAGALGVLFVGLSLNVIRVRRIENVNLGSQGKPRLGRAIRAHANFAEYVPLVLLLMGIAELSETPVWRLHLMGSGLLIGRFVHAYCFALTDGHLLSRVVGIALTFAALIAATVECLRVAL